jgi:acyl-lipid omega-6 desaturase (Delta-12 desaturase)
MSERVPSKVYSFGPFLLDVGERRLLRDGSVVPLVGKAFDTLRLLVESAGKLQTQETLIDRLWPDVVVEPNICNTMSRSSGAPSRGRPGSRSKRYAGKATGSWRVSARRRQRLREAPRRSTSVCISRWHTTEHDLRTPSSATDCRSSRQPTGSATWTTTGEAPSGPTGSSFSAGVDAWFGTTPAETASPTGSRRRSRSRISSRIWGRCSTPRAWSGHPCSVFLKARRRPPRSPLEIRAASRRWSSWVDAREGGASSEARRFSSSSRRCWSSCARVGAGSFTHVRWLNRLIGRIAFLPSLQPYSLWDLTHNRIHHAFTNLKGKDFVWTPLSKAEFDALPWGLRALYRSFRTPLGLALYYPIELWWPRLIFPRREQLDRKRLAYDLDRLLVLLFACLQGTLVVSLRSETLGDGVAAGAFGVFVTYLVFSWMIGFVIVFNHTHLDVPWFDRVEVWSASRSAIESTTRLKFPRWTAFFASSIMDHVAHHVDPRIPLVRLGEAQDQIEELLPGRIIVHEWSVKGLCDILKRCKLYDYDAGRWIDYDGLPTTGSESAFRRCREEVRCQPS